MVGDESVSPSKNNKISGNTVSTYLQLTADFYGSPRVSFICLLNMSFISRVEASILEIKDIFN